MSTLPGTPGWSSDNPAKPMETPSGLDAWERAQQRALDEGDLCGACGAWLPGGADPEVRALHLCESEPQEDVSLADTQTGQGIL